MNWNPEQAQALGEQLIHEAALPLGTEITAQVFTNPDRLQFNARRGQQAGAVAISREALDAQGEAGAGLALNELLDLITDERLSTSADGSVPLLAMVTTDGLRSL